MQIFENTIFWIATTTYALLAFTCAIHALLLRRDPRSSMAWIVVSLTVPYIGPLLYMAFGVNRVQQRALTLFPEPRYRLFPGPQEHKVTGEGFEACALVNSSLDRLCYAGWSLSGRPTVRGNQVEVLEGGELFFPAMLDMIRQARSSVLLQSYIFENDAIGSQFVTEMGNAVARGVRVCVILDGVGTLYGKGVAEPLRELGVEVEYFLPLRFWPPTPLINLRNHRKLMIVDGCQAVMGGANISARHLLEDDAQRFPTHDIQFRVSGPVVHQLFQAFHDDWRFVRGNALPEISTPAPVDGHDAVARALADGPDDTLDKLVFLLMAATAEASERIIIQTPYFLPPRELLTALSAAALRGVQVQVLLPSRSNLVYVDWATRNLLWELLQRGVQVREHPGPFSHAKLFVVDGSWSLVGSSNLDPRSLRLNFELGLEIYDEAVANELVTLFDNRWAASSDITLAQVDGRPFFQRVRDSIAWLAWPYL